MDPVKLNVPAELEQPANAGQDAGDAEREDYGREDGEIGKRIHLG
jgi:hypothetical protein